MNEIDMSDKMEQFIGYLDEKYGLVELPSGEYLTMAEVYRKFSPGQYIADFKAWMDAQLTE